MKISIIKSSFITIEKDGNRIPQLQNEIIANDINNLIEAWAIYNSASASLSEALSNKALYTTTLLIVIETAIDTDGFNSIRYLKPSSYSELEKEIIEQARNVSMTNLLSAIQDSLGMLTHAFMSNNKIEFSSIKKSVEAMLAFNKNEMDKAMQATEKNVKEDILSPKKKDKK